MSRVRRIAFRLAVVPLVTLLVGCGGGAADPARAAAPASAVRFGADGWACDWSGCGYYVDRATTQQWAAFFRKWDKAADGPAAFATAYCTRFGATVAGLCAAGVITTSSMFLDHLQQADALGGCLEFQLFDVREPGGVLIDAYDGPKCTGTRS